VLAVLGLSAEGSAQSAAVRLVEAAKHQEWKTVRALVAERAEVNASAPDGATALHWAVHWDDVATVELLLRSGAKAEAPNALAITPLMLACVNGSSPVVERLLKAGANPNAASATRETALMLAARSRVWCRPSLGEDRLPSCGRAPKGTTQLFVLSSMLAPM
jgi:ankyrin repeat protein